MSIQHQIKQEPKPTELPIKKIRVDGGTQPRIGIDDQTVDSYAEAISEGAVFPPVTVFHDGTNYWLADGFHRFRAHQKAGKAKIAVDVRQGSRRDAILFSVGANAIHGLRRTNADKRRAVITLLKDEEWSKKGPGWVAEKCAVSGRFVSKVAEEEGLSLNNSKIEVSRGGSTYTMNAANIGRSQSANAASDGVSEAPSAMNVSAIGKAETQETPDFSDDDFYDPLAEEAERERAAELRAEQAAKQAHTQPQAGTQAASDAPTSTVPTEERNGPVEPSKPSGPTYDELRAAIVFLCDLKPADFLHLCPPPKRAAMFQKLSHLERVFEQVREAA